MILLKSLQLNNFLSHKDTKIDFEPTSRVLFDGKSGAGKSSIVEALTWAIFNKGRVQSRSLIKRGATEATVALELVNGEDTWKIVRKINSRGVHQLQLFCNDSPAAVAGTKNIQDYIESELVKCSYSLFINSVCYPQENLDSFVRQTPANRKNLILELVHAQLYDSYYEKVKTVASEAKEKIAYADREIARLTPELESNQKLAADIPTHEQAEKNLRTELEVKNGELSIVNERYLSQKSLSMQIGNIDTDLSRMRSEVMRLQTSKADYEKKASAITAIDKEDLTAKHKEFEALSQELELVSAWETQVSNLKANAPSLGNYRELIEHNKKDVQALENKLAESPTETCPNCTTSHPCGLIHAERKARLDAQKKVLAEYIQRQQEFDIAEAAFMEEYKKLESRKPAKSRSDIQSKLQLLKPYEELFYKLESQEELKKKYLEEAEALGKQADEIIEIGKQRKAEQDELKKQLNIEEVEKSKNSITLEVNTLNGKIQDITYKRMTAQAALERVGKLEADIETVRKDQAEQQAKGDGLVLLKDAFGPNGIKAIVVDYVIPQLEDRMNTILSRLSAFRIALNTQKSNVEGDATIEGLFITIINDQGEEFDYDSYSGGQKTKITFAISEGLAELQKLGFRILDEAVIGLDEDTGHEFAETIMALDDRFSQLLCVSHVREIKDLFDQKLLIVNRNGDSEIIV